MTLSSKITALEGAEVLAQKAIDACRRIGAFSESKHNLTRTFLSPETRAVHAFLSPWMHRLAMQVEVDAAGNLRGYYPAVHNSAPRLIIGSHIDTVPDAGAFDGVLGVVLGLCLIESLERQHLDYGIEVIAFSEEEGVRFGTPFIGSLAVIGELSSELLQRRDDGGITLEHAIRDYGLDPAKLSSAKLSPDSFAYVEFHIEQGPVLEELNLPLGVVEAIAGQSRLEITFRGSANHAGTTPMHFRRDALAGAAEWIVAVEQQALSVSGLVATVGHITAHPGATNVIAGAAMLSLDIRHAEDSIRASAVTSLLNQARLIAETRGLTLTVETRVDQPAVKMDGTLKKKLEAAGTEFNPHPMASGAGHDAMVLARKVPSAMLFLRSPGGISHHPDETVLLEDVIAALRTGYRFLMNLHVP